MILAPNELDNIKIYLLAFYAAYTAQEILSCELTHTTVIPFDLIKCNMQIDPTKYKSISFRFGVFFKEQGLKGFCCNWVSNLLDYSAYGTCKFEFYKFFKKYYSNIVRAKNASKYKTLIYLAGFAFAEVIANVALCPFEDVKDHIKRSFASGLANGLLKFVKSKGTLGLYKGLVEFLCRKTDFIHNDEVCFF